VSIQHRVVGLACVILATLDFACEPPPPPAPGAECREGAAICNGPHGALVCVANRLAAASCGGPRGCSVDTARSMVLCDESVADVGEPCWQGSWSTGGRSACSRDRKHALICEKNHFAVMATCKGPTGCANQSPMVQCDSRIADEGDPCLEGAVACSTSGATLLACREHRFAVDATCRGPKACHESTTGIRCDSSVAEAGDPCGGTGGVACSADHTSLLKCEDSKMSVVSPCKGKAGCTADEGTIRCDQSIAAVGEACDEGPACTADAKQILACKDGKRVVERACPKGCEVRVAEHIIECR